MRWPLKSTQSKRIIWRMMNLKKLMTVAAVLALAACATDKPLPGPVPQVGFSHLAPLTFNVTRVDIATNYVSPMAAPNVEHQVPTSPQRAMTDWAQARLKASPVGGTQTVANFVIEDAAVIETKLKKSTGFTGLMTYEPTERYDARATASLSLQDPLTGSHGSIRVSASRTMEVRENATLAEREQAWVELVEGLMADFNAQADEQIRTHMMPWLLN